MSTAWIWLSALGNSKWLLPGVMLFIVTASASGNLPRRDGLRWSVAIAATALTVLASKIAFMGWGVGSAALDFTGISGHAAMATCIYPPLAALLCAHHPRLRGPLIVAAALLAAAIAYSRLPLHAHSPSEVIAGTLLGGLASLFVITRGTQRMPALATWQWIVPAIALVCCLQAATPKINTHGMVVAMARTLSGQDQLHTRRWLHQRSGSSRAWQETSAKNLAKTIDKPSPLGQHVSVGLSHMDFRSPP
ncbi:MAG: phosphatase PAP2 family protein [Pseudomonas sp.]